MSVAYERTIEVSATSGEPNDIELGLPMRGTIRKLIVNQVTGNDEGYSFDLYNNEAAVKAAVGSESSDSAAAQPNQHKVIPTQTVAPGSRAVEHWEKVWAYANADGTPSTRKTRLYLRITPNGTGIKSFELSFAIDTAQW